MLLVLGIYGEHLWDGLISTAVSRPAAVVVPVAPDFLLAIMLALLA